MKYFSSNLKYLIKTGDLTSEKFAEKIGLTAGALSSYVTGRVVPKIDIVTVIASYFNVSLEDLVNKDLSVEGISQLTNTESQELKELLVHAYKNIYNLEREIEKLKGADKEFEKIDRAAEAQFPYLLKKGKEDDKHD